MLFIKMPGGNIWHFYFTIGARIKNFVNGSEKFFYFYR
jgi:hypothetical protein